MIWLNAEEALMSTTPSACGPRAFPASRNTATSGTPIFCARKAASVPIARISPQASSVCCAMAMELDASICRLIQSLQPLGVFDALVAERIAARGEHVGGREASQRFDARRRAAPVVDVGTAHV